ncbi:MAG: PAS domain S-box protein [Candidatus Margulisbacteria bacterium]|nr:PAS domain S-box protein [Candidatus Margulisiibacteriota bacterium]
MGSDEELKKAVNISEKEYEKLLGCKVFFNNSPDLYYEIDSDGKIADCNRRVLEVLGYKKEELVGKPLVPTIYAPESQQKAKALLEKWKKEGKLRNEELQIRTKQGEIIDVELSVDAVRDEAGKILRSTSVQRNITQRKRVEEEKAKLASFMTGREVRIIELKNEVNQLLKQLGLPTRYKA